MHKYIQLSDDLTIQYVSSGKGRPLIFIPGWTMTVESFSKNLQALSDRFRVIAYDPRSQGRSSKLQSGNDYTQHGRDLAAFIRELKLTDVVLIGWSTGVLTAYSYFEQFGCNNVSAFVSIDMSPKPVKDTDSDWGIDLKQNVRRVQAGVTAPDHSDVVRKFASHAYLTQPADEEFVEDMVARSLCTAPHVAALLLADGNLCNYSGIAREVAARLPVLQVVNEHAAPAARNWIEANTPNAELVALGAHMMFWEFPERFNAVVSNFLEDRSDT